MSYATQILVPVGGCFHVVTDFVIYASEGGQIRGYNSIPNTFISNLVLPILKGMLSFIEQYIAKKEFDAIIL